jgi:hypothetical protein
LPPDEYYVWRADEQLVALEREQWAIFVERNQWCEEGAAVIEPHPGHGGVATPASDELTASLTPRRQAPADARSMVAEWRYGGGNRYRVNGVGYWVRWRER